MHIPILKSSDCYNNSIVLQALCSESEIQYLLSHTNSEREARRERGSFFIVLLQACSANNARNYESAMSFSRASFCCNMCVIVQFIVALTAAIIGVAVYFIAIQD